MKVPTKEEIAGARSKAFAERRIELRRRLAALDSGDWCGAFGVEEEIPYLPNENTLYFSYDEWRRVYQGQS